MQKRHATLSCHTDSFERVKQTHRQNDMENGLSEREKRREKKMERAIYVPTIRGTLDNKAASTKANPNTYTHYSVSSNAHCTSASKAGIITIVLSLLYIV